MGGICSRKSIFEEPEGISRSLRAEGAPEAWVSPHNGSDKTVMLPTNREVMEKDSLSPARKGVIFYFDNNEIYEREVDASYDKKRLSRVLSEKARTARAKTNSVARKGAAKMSEVGSLLGKAGQAGLGKTLEAIDTIGSTLTNLNGGGVAKRNKIGILAFEIANTVVKGNNLKLSLSTEEIKILKEETLLSEGVQRLVSQDMNVLLRIAAADKRDELKIFAGEVIRFGNRCRDPQWHKLDRVFSRLGDEVPKVPKISKEHADSILQYLMILAQHTAELYHELHALDRCQGDLKRKQAEEISTGSQRGESISILKSDLKSQQKHVKNLKKRSLWSKILEEIMEKLVELVYYLYQELERVFPDVDEIPMSTEGQLGASGLALHYANLINQIESLVARPTSVPPNTRDNLYQGLPPSIKAALRNKLQSAYKDEQSVSEIRDDIDKTLDWLAIVAANTTKAHHGFGWVGEWANTGLASDRRLPGHTDLTLLQTLHHADQAKTEGFILELIVGLHHLVSRARSSAVNGHKSPMKSPIRPATFPALPQGPQVVDRERPAALRANGQHDAATPALTEEDREMLSIAIKAPRKFPLGTSKSQEFNKDTDTLKMKTRLSKSNSHSPSTLGGKDAGPKYQRRHPCSAQALPISPLDLDIDRIKELDVIDRVDSLIGSTP